MATLKKQLQEQSQQIKQLQKDLQTCDDRLECAEGKRGELIEFLRDIEGESE
jgi:hypothetical protein